MADGWVCENCDLFFGANAVQTKIVVSLEPRDYDAPATFCSLKCLDEYRPALEDMLAEAQEYHPSNAPRIRWRIVEEEVDQA